MAHVRINETVWCNTGKPSYELLTPPDRQALIEWVILNHKSDEKNIFCDDY